MASSALHVCEPLFPVHPVREVPAPRAPARIVARRGRALVFLVPAEIWAFEAQQRLTFVHTRYRKLDFDLSLVEVESTYERPLLRVHRNWLVDAAHVRSLTGAGRGMMLFVGERDESAGIHVPVAGGRAPGVRAMLLGNAVGLRSQANP